ncbi:GEVED domain-containing protein, partial [Flavobacterium sp.]|uniref:beta strand repeat-containing protein n=1 Tax=Flavobacterium sp. TaxID=239 RepID=UPI002607675F
MRTSWLMSLFLMVILLSGNSSWSQVSSYGFTATTGTYTQVSAGATQLTAVQADSGISATQNIGFSFTYAGTAYTQFRMSSNGFISLNTTAATLTANDLSTANAASRPIIAPLWDDLDGAATGGSYAGYEVTGTAPNRVLTVEWRNWEWNWNSTTPVISFQVKLYETSNNIEFNYRSEAGAVASGSASIGIGAATGSGSGSYLNLTSVSTPAVSSTTSMTTIATKPASNTLYRFTPPAPCTGTPIPGTISAALNACSGTAPGAVTVTGFTTGVSGITFQWEQSDTNNGTDWVNAVGGSGATTASYTPPALTATRYYRVRVGCSTSGLFDYTNTLTFSIANCEFNATRTTGITYNSIQGTGIGLTGFSSLDDSSSSATNIGFNFFYKGTTFTQFVANTNGFLALGASTGSSFTNSLGTGTNIIAPFWDDLFVTGSVPVAQIGTYIKYQLDGTAPNRVLTVEWIGMEQFGYAGPNLNFQVKLYETSNNIEIIHGSMEAFNGTTSTSTTTSINKYSYSVGLAGPSGTGTFRTLAQLGENTGAFGSTDPTSLSVIPECNVRYAFTAGAYTGPTTFAYSAPVNDNSSGAISLAVNSSPCVNLCGTYYTTGSATASPEASGCTTAPDDDVWFSFVAPASGQVTISVKGATGFDAVVGLLDAAFVNLAGFTCVNATTGSAINTNFGQTETLDPTGLTPGATYYVRVSHNGTGFGSRSGFSICVSDSLIAVPTNDEPCGAITLTPGAGSTCSPYVDNTAPSGTASSTTSLIGATSTTSNGVLAPTCSGAGSPIRDVWFKFTATGDRHGMTVVPVPGFDVAVEGYTATTGTTCPTNLTLNSIGCVNGGGTGATESIVITTVVGQEYYFRVYRHPSGFTGAPVSNSQFNICIFSPIPACATNTAPVAAATGVSITPTLTWNSVNFAASYDVYLGTTSGPATLLQANVPNTATTTSYTLTAGQVLQGLTQYFWYVVPKNSNGVASCGVANESSFTTQSACTVPSALTASGYSTITNTVNLSWSAPTIGASPVGYEYAVTNSATAPTSGTFISGTSLPSFSVSPDLTYYLWVRTACTIGSDYSGWVSTSFQTGYCPSTGAASASYYINNFTTTGGIANISNLNSGLSVNGYQNATAQFVSQVVGGTVNFNITSDTGVSDYGYAIFVDWNNDLDFADAGESVYNSGAYLIGTSGSFTVPAGQAFGNYRMRVVSNFLSTTPVACNTAISGETEDYTMRVVPQPIVISSFSPTSVCSNSAAGTVVTLTGSNFTNTNDVQLNGVSVPFTFVSDNTITVTLSASSTTGNFVAYSPITFGSSTTVFTVNPSPVVPALSGPDSVCTDETITLTAVTGGTWSSDSPVATVIGGVVTGVSAGVAVISYTVNDGICSTTVSKTITVSEKVVVTTNPQNVTALTGSNISFSVTATGTGLTYVWQESTDEGISFNDIVISAPYSISNGGATLNITSVPGGAIPTGFNGRLYQCVVSGTSPCGPQTSGSASLAVGSTAIVTNPQSNAPLCETGTASFSVEASGDVNSYQWFLDRNDGNGPILITNGLIADGITYTISPFSTVPASFDNYNSTLSLSGVNFLNGVNGFLYYAVVNGPVSNPQSSPATLNVSQGVSVSTEPSSTTVCRAIGAPQFTVGVNGTVGSIQWQQSTSATGPWSNVSGGTSATLIVNVTGSTPVGVTYYKAIVNGVAPCTSVESTVVSLTVTQPTITVSPASAVSCSGSAVTLTANGASTYTWSPATGLFTDAAATVAYVAGSPFTTVYAKPASNTTYTVTGTTIEGCTNTTTVMVTTSTAITSAATADKLTICPNDVVQLNAAGVQAFTTSPVTGYAFAATTGTYTQVSSGATQLTSVQADFAISATQNIGFTFNYGGVNYTQFKMSSDGYISLNPSATNTGTNNLSTANAALRPIIAPLWDDLDGNATGGSFAGYEVTGIAPNRVLTIEWRNWEWNWNSSSPVISFQTKLYENTNVIEFLYRSEAGAVNLGSATIGIGAPTGSGANSYLNLTSVTTPAVSSTTSTTNIATKPATGTLYRFTPGNSPTYTYAWTSTAGFTSTLKSPTVIPTVSDTYTVVVTSAGGCTSTSAVTVNISANAVITTEPVAPAPICQGGTTSLTVGASGPGLTYQWMLNGNNITGATSATYTITNASVAQSGSYTVLVTPSCGTTATSTPVSLVVNPTPTVTAPTNQAYCLGTSITSIPLSGTPSGVTFDITGGATVGLPNQTGVTSIPSFTGIVGAATITITPRANGCSGTPVTYNIIVNDLPSAVTVNPSSSTICLSGSPILLSGQGGIVPAPAASTYCVSTHTSGCSGDNISRVVLNTLDRTTGTACGVSAAYSNFSGLTGANTTTLTAGTAYSLSLTFGSDSNQYFGAWIDYNHDGAYSASEFLGASGNAGSNGTIAISFTPSATVALNGITRMRIVGGNDLAVTSTQACGASSSPWGETQDYDVTIVGGVSSSTYIWNSTNGGLFTDAAGTSVYNGTTPLASIYALPTTSSIITATSTSLAGCSSSGSTTITVNPTSVAGTASAVASVLCSGSATTISLSGNVGSIQWQQSANGTTWSNISGATSATLNTGSLTSTTYYQAVVTSGVCSSATSNVVMVTVNSVTYGSISTTTACLNTNATLTVSGLVANSTSTIAYTLGGVAQTPVNVVANASGVGTFEVFLATTGQSVVVTSVTRVDVTPSCPLVPTSGTSVVLIVNTNCSTIAPATCGTTLAGWFSTVTATWSNLAQGYRFRITKVDMNTNAPIAAPVIIDRPVNNISLANVPGTTYNSRYMFEVAVMMNGVWQSFYGPACYLNTPNPVSTIGAQCGSTLTAMNQWINAGAVSNVTAYRFRVTRVIAGVPTGASQETTQGINRFNMTQLSGILFASTYRVEVSLRNTDGTFLPYGTPCDINTPAY